jgi:peptide/nickel transport system substrate-binding protein
VSEVIWALQEEDPLPKIADAALTYRALLAALGLFLMWSLLWSGYAAAQPEALRIIDSSEDPLTLHPNRAFDPNSCVVIGHIFEGLLDYDTSGELVPKLAVRWERKSPTRLRFWLRKGVTFHNGEPFDSQTVATSVSRQFHGTVRSANSWLFDPELRVEILDRYTVDLVTGHPDSRLPYTLVMFMPILPPRYLESVGDEGLARHPVGTGPYRFVRWNRGHSIQLEANPEYWRQDLPRIPKVDFLFVPQAQQVTELLEGRADLVTKLRGNDTFRVMATRETKVVKRQVAAVFWVAMKNSYTPFTDRRVRLAMNYAVNKLHLIQYVDKGNALRVSTMTNPIERDYNPDLKAYPFDPDQARRLLMDAGFADGFRVRVLAAEETADMMRAIKAQLRKVGVTLDLTIVSREEYLRQTIVPKLTTGSPKFDGEMFAWLTPNPTLDAFFVPAVIFYSGSPYSVMRSGSFDELYLSFVRETDTAKRRQILFRLQDLTLSEAYGIYTSQRIQTYGLRKDLEIDIHPSGMLTGDVVPLARWRTMEASEPKGLRVRRTLPAKAEAQ